MPATCIRASPAAFCGRSARRGYLSEQHLYDATQEVRWQDLMSAQQTLRVDVTASRSPLQSLEFAMLRIKDGIVDRMRELTGARPSIDRSNPDVRVFAYLDASTITLYVDLSGEAAVQARLARRQG